MAPSTPTLRAVLFDLDGTLADSYAAITASVNHVRAFHDLPPLQEDEVRCHVGRGPEYLLDKTVGGSDFRADLARYRAHHPSVLRSGTRLLPGAAAMLRALKEAGLLLGICSNKPRGFTLLLLEYLDLRGAIDVVVGPEDVAHIKPAPDMLLTALASLSVPAEQALYVGDMVVDLEAGRAAGVRVWVVATGSDTRATLVSARAERVLDGLDQLPALVFPLRAPAS